MIKKRIRIQKLYQAKIQRARERHADYLHKKNVLISEYRRMKNGKQKLGAFSLRFPTSRRYKKYQVNKKPDILKTYAENKDKEAFEAFKKKGSKALSG